MAVATKPRRKTRKTRKPDVQRFPRIARTVSSGEVLSLSTPNKMPCYSWSLPAITTCPGSKVTVKQYGEDATCASCYATSGFYRMPSTANAQAARFRWVLATLAHDDGAEFVATMVDMITESVRACGVPLFRVHDSGDLFSVGYIKTWQRICAALPGVRFWFPTRSHVLPNLLPALQELAALPNVSVRPSAPEMDTPAPVIPGLSAGTTVLRSPLPTIQATHQACPATGEGDPRCAAHGCTRCWDKVGETIYWEH